MAQTGYSKVQIYSSSTATNTPSAGNLTNDTNGSELAINITDGKLFYKDNSGTVQVLATKATALSTVTNNGVVYVNSSGQATSGSALVFDGTNLGLGVTPDSIGSNWKALELANGIYLASYTGSTNADMYLGCNNYWNGTAYIGKVSGYNATQYEQYQGQHRWWNTNGSNVTGGSSFTFTQAMTLDASGNLLLGTTSTSFSSGTTAEISGSSAATLTLSNGATPRMYLFANSSESRTASYGVTPLTYFINGTERARIDTSGNLLVGNTATNLGVFTVYNNATNFASVQALAYLKGTQASDSGMTGLFIAKYANDSTPSQILARFTINNGANGQGQINANGAGAVAFGSYSDSRLKENIVTLPSQLSNILALHPVEFDYIEAEGGGHQVGFIAQEFQQVYPDAVSKREPDGMLTVTGWSKTEARLVKAIQELSAQVTTLQTQVTALKG